MITDIHAHYHPDRFVTALEKARGRGPGAMAPHPDTDSEAHIQERLAMMEHAGVGLQVLSPAASRAPYGNDEATAVEAARVINDMSAELVARYPDKFKSFVSLPLPHIEASMDELKRGMDELGFAGVNLHISVNDRSVAEDEFLPIYEEMNRRNGIIFYHPCASGICSPMITDYGFNAAVGTSLEDTVIALHLIAKKIPSQFPNIKYVIPHLGGPVAMLLERLDNQYSMQANNLPEPPSVTARRFYYDTVGHGSKAALHCAYLAFGSEQILPGSDFPVLLSYETYRDTFSWIKDAGLPEADVNQILEVTAPKLLGM
ncbi:MAG: amidohydrolase family protein [Dehalococcoidia bacterium]